MFKSSSEREQLGGIYKTFDVSKSVAINPACFDVARAAEDGFDLNPARLGVVDVNDSLVVLWGLLNCVRNEVPTVG